MGYSKKALSGFTGQTALRLLTYGLGLGRLFVLTRLLTPGDFGLFSLTLIALGVSEAATQTGVNITILQAKQSIKYFVDTAWVIAIIRGFIISALMIAMGFGLSRFFDQPELLFLITWVSLVPIIKGFINPAIVALHKELNFKADTLYRASCLVVETVAAVALVFVFRSVFAWLGAFILAALFEVVVSFLFVKPRPKFQYRPSPAKDILGNAKGFSLQAVLSYLLENMDNLIIGRVNGVFALGLYDPTYSIAHHINYDIAKSVHHSTLPVYTKIMDDRRRLRRAFMRAAGVTAGLAFVTSLPFLLFPQVVISIIFGSDWAGATELLPWLVVAGWLQTLALIGYGVLLARNRLRTMNIHLGISFVFMGVLMVILGLQYGLLGAVLGLVISRALSLPLLWMFIRPELRVYE